MSAGRERYAAFSREALLTELGTVAREKREAEEEDETNEAEVRVLLRNLMVMHERCAGEGCIGDLRAVCM